MAFRLGPLLKSSLDTYMHVKTSSDIRLKKLLKQLVKETVLAGSQPDESYKNRMIDDPAFNKKSVYVADDIKDVIKKWLKAMKLD